MANEESFLLVSLEESKAKKLAQVISNDTSRTILDLLAKKDATETQISKELKIPLSTVHYNIKALVDANLVIIEEYHYSEKGKEVNHYKLANKLIIIAPQEKKAGLKEALKKFLPITLIVLGFAAIIQLVQTMGRKAWSIGADTTQAAPKIAPVFMDNSVAEAERAVAEEVSKTIPASGGDMALSIMQDSADTVINMINQTINSTMNSTINVTKDLAADVFRATPEVVAASPIPFAMWFLIGALFVILLFVIFEIVAAKRKK